MLIEFVVPLLTKMALTALVVVSTTVVAERSGPAIGGIIVSLPVVAGPGYLFLALQASDAFIASTALYSFGALAATILFMAAFVRAAPRFGAATTLALAIVAWLGVVSLVRLVELDWWTGLGLNAAAFALAFRLCRGPVWPAALGMLRPSRRDLLMRALLAGGLVATVVSLSNVIGPAATGFGVVFPTMLTTLGWILHRRYGGSAAAAMLAASLRPMVGFIGFLSAVYFLAVPVGAWWALAAGVAASVAWALLLLGLRPASKPT